MLTLVWITSRGVSLGERLDQRFSTCPQLQGSVNQVPEVGIKKFEKSAICSMDQFREVGLPSVGGPPWVVEDSARNGG